MTFWDFSFIRQFFIITLGFFLSLFFVYVICRVASAAVLESIRQYRLKLLDSILRMEKIKKEEGQKNVAS